MVPKAKAKKTTPHRLEGKERLIFYCDQVIEWGLILVAFFVPLIFTTSTGADIFNLPRLLLLRIITIPVALAWVIRLLESREYYRLRNAMLLPVLAVLLSWLLSSIFSLRPEASFMGNYLRQEGFWTIVNMILLFFIVSSTFKTTKQVDNLLRVMLWSAFFTMAYGLIQFVGLDWMPWAASGNRPFSTLGNPDFFPHFLIMLLPIAIMKFLHARSLELKIYLCLFVALMAFNVVVAQTRGAYIGVALSIPVLAFFVGRKTYRENRVWLYFIGGALILLGGFLIWKMDFLASILRGGLQQTRFFIWLGGLGVFLAYPILGVGPDALRVASPAYKVLKYSLLEPMNNPDRMHNQYLDEMIMRGAIGLLVYIWMLAAFFWKSLQVWRRTADPYWKAMIAGIAVGVLAFLAQNLVAFGVIPTILYFWLLLGMNVALWQIDLSPAPAEIKSKKELAKAQQRETLPVKVPPRKLPALIPTTLRWGICLLVAAVLVLHGYWTVRLFAADVAYGSGEIAIRTAQAYSKQASSEQDATRKEKLQAELNRQATIALESYQRAVDLNPWEAGYRTATEGHTSGLGNLLYQFAMGAGDTKQKEELLAKARAQWEEALKTTMYVENVYMQIGRSYQDEAEEKPDQRKELLRIAAENFEKGAAADPGDYPLYFNLSFIYSELEDYERSVYFAEKGVVYAQTTENRKDSLIYAAQSNYNYRVNLTLEGKEEEAAKYLERARELAEEVLKIDPENTTAKDIINRIGSS